jgi:hypothetical protein
VKADPSAKGLTVTVTRGARGRGEPGRDRGYREQIPDIAQGGDYNNDGNRGKKQSDGGNRRENRDNRDNQGRRRKKSTEEKREERREKKEVRRKKPTRSRR